MSKQAKGRSAGAGGQCCFPKGNFKGDTFQNVPVAKTDPKKQQFEPTDAEPVRQRFKMAGGC